jgi:hypothetical protein
MTSTPPHPLDSALAQLGFVRVTIEDLDRGEELPVVFVIFAADPIIMVTAYLRSDNRKIRLRYHERFSGLLKMSYVNVAGPIEPGVFGATTCGHPAAIGGPKWSPMALALKFAPQILEAPTAILAAYRTAIVQSNDFCLTDLTTLASLVGKGGQGSQN